MPKHNNYFLPLFWIVLTCFNGISAEAQENGEDQLGAWYMYFGTNTLSDKFSLHSEAQFRYYEVSGRFNQLLLRTGLNYHLNASAIATLGYGYIATDGSYAEPPAETNAIEHRIFQQFILKNTVGKVAVEHRYRLEQRFLDFRPGTDLEHRARYRLQLTLPLSGAFFLNFYDEVFLNFQDEIFGQNRAYAALGIKLSATSSLQLGYLKNHFRNAHFDRFQLGVFFNPDLRKLLNIDPGPPKS